MDFIIKPIIKRNRFGISECLRRTISFSVDCDALVDYLNFAPLGTHIDDPHTYGEMCLELLALFDKHNIKATFFCIADRLENEETLQVFKSIVSKGHAIGNHTYSHPDIAALDEDSHLEEIEKAHEKIVKALGVRPRGYRGPAYYISTFGLCKLVELGYHYDSSVYNALLTRVGVKVFSRFCSRLQGKRASGLARKIKYVGPGPYAMDFGNGLRLLEWPIPSAFGLNYYGTLHCVLPSGFSYKHGCWVTKTIYITSYIPSRSYQEVALRITLGFRLFRGLSAKKTWPDG